MSRHIDAALTSGTSPGGRRSRIHLLGPGAVGRALLRRIGNSRHTLVAVTDSRGTICDDAGLDGAAIAEWKERHASLSGHTYATRSSWQDVVHEVDADIVIDATPSDARVGWSASLEAAVLQPGRSLVLVAKTSIAERSAIWLNDRYAPRVGINAVLGGTGNSFIRALPALRTECTSVVVVGNASTTTIIAAIERGGSFDDGIADARRLGYLEPDPECDLRGRDAAVKLAIVAGAIHGRVIDANSIPCDDIRSLSPLVVRDRARNGLTTRLVARLSPAGEAAVAYEAVAAESILAAPCGRVVYQYDVRSGDRHIYVGEGLGAEATAAAAWVDVQSLSRSRPVLANVTAGGR